MKMGKLEEDEGVDTFADSSKQFTKTLFRSSTTRMNRNFLLLFPSVETLHLFEHSLTSTVSLQRIITHEENLGD